MYLSDRTRSHLRQPIRRAQLPARFLTGEPLGVLPVVIPAALKAIKLVAAIVPLIKHGTAQPAFAAVQAANVPGRALDITALNMGTYYLYSMESHGLYKLNRAFGKKKGFETFLVTFTQKIGDAARAGKLSNSDDAEAVYQKVIVPWLQPILGNIEASWKKLFVAYVDRYLYGQTFGAIDSRITKLADVMQQANASAATTPSATVSTGTASTVPVIDVPTAPAQSTAQMLPSSTLTLPSPSETAAPTVPTMASLFGGTPGWLIPTLIGAGVLLLTRNKGRRK